MEPVHAGYAIGVRQSATGEIGYLQSQRIGYDMAYMQKILHPRDFLTDMPEYIRKNMEALDVTIERLVSVEAVPVEKDVSPQERRKFHMLDKAVVGLSRATVEDVMGADVAGYARGVLWDAMSLRGDFNRALGATDDAKDVFYMGAVILEADGTVTFSDGKSYRPGKVNADLKSVVEKRLLNSIYDRQTLLLLAPDGKKTRKVAGIYLRLNPESPRNLNARQIRGIVERSAASLAASTKFIPR